MYSLNVTLENHCKLQLDGDWAVLKELSEYLTFTVPDHRFMPAFRNGAWDGKIKLVDVRAKTVDAGLFKYVEKFCRDRKYQLTVNQSKYGSPNQAYSVDITALRAFLRGVDTPHDVRPYQQSAIEYSVENRRGILVCPTASGKSFIMYMIMQSLLYHQQIDGKLLIVVPDIGLVEQLFGDLRDYGFDVDNNVHTIYSGKDKNTDKRIVVSTWQSIYKLDKKWFSQFGAVFGDEVHLFKANSLKTLMGKLTEAAYRIGLTGTLDGTTTHRFVLEGLFGPVYNVTTTKQLQDAGYLAELSIDVVKLVHPSDTWKQISVYDDHTKKYSFDYQKEVDFLVAHEKRNKLISNLAINQSGNTLILFRYVDKHGRALYDMIRNKIKDGRKVFFVHGKVGADDRDQIRKIVEAETDAIIVASLGVFSTGINIRNLHNLILASPSRSQIKVLQSIGRSLRKSDDGRASKVFDIADSIKRGKAINNTLRHCNERIKMYQKQQFKYKVIEVDL